MNKKRSEMWNYFTLVNENSAKCTFCNELYSYKGGATANLTRHLKRKHPTALVNISATTNVARRDQNVVELEPNPNESSTSTSTSSNVAITKDEAPTDTKQRKIFQTTLTNFTKRPLPLQTRKQLDEQLMIMIAAEYQTFSIVEDKEFEKFVSMLNPNYTLPSRKTVSNVLLPQLYTKVVENVRQLLSTVEYVAITTDGWTSINNQSFQSLTVHFINHRNQLTSLLLDCYHFNSEERHTAENLSETLKQLLSKWEISEKVCAAVTDNAANITAAIRISNWRHIPCFAHSLNLIVQKGLNEIQESRNKAKSVVEFFKRSPIATAKLETLQKQMDLPNLKLKQDVVTRWNSTFDMLDRIVKIKEPLLSAIAVTNCNTMLTPEDFNIFSLCCMVLKPFKNITEEMSSEKGVTISKVILFSAMLNSTISNLKANWDNETPHQVLKFCDCILTELQKRFHDVEENVICSEATFLDPRFKKYGFKKESSYKNTYKRIQQTVSALISKEQSQTKTATTTGEAVVAPDESIWNEFDTQILQAKTDLNPTASAIIEIDKYLQEPVLNRNNNPLEWWKERKYIYPNLYQIMKRRFCIPATSVPSERIFSKTGQILNERRSRLSPAKVDKLVFLNSNLHVVKG